MKQYNFEVVDNYDHKLGVSPSSKSFKPIVHHRSVSTNRVPKLMKIESTFDQR